MVNNEIKITKIDEYLKIPKDKIQENKESKYNEENKRFSDICKKGYIIVTLLLAYLSVILFFALNKGLNSVIHFNDMSDLFWLVFIFVIYCALSGLLIYINKNFFQHLYPRKPILYLGLIYLFFLNFASSITLIIYYYVLYCGNSIIGQNTYYFLSSIIQSLAAIIAIVFTLTIIFVQLTNTRYSQRFGDFFKYYWEWKIILAVYIITIFYSFIILQKNYSNELGWLEGYISFFLVTYSLIIIFPYTWNTITFLRPDNVIANIFYIIPKLENNRNKTVLDEENFFIELFFDIINGSLNYERPDLITFENCMEYLDNLLYNLYKLRKKDPIDKIITHLDKTLIICRYSSQKAILRRLKFEYEIIYKIE